MSAYAGHFGRFLGAVPGRLHVAAHDQPGALAAITAKVKAAILAEPGLKSLQINVDTSGATVTLSGNVDNADLKERAKQIASNTSGVKGVVDQLAVKSS